MSRLFRDPLFHFALLGALLFGLFITRQEPGPGDDEITVSFAQQEQLATAFARVWRREPSPAELKGLIDDWVREELANREAVTMGLAENDLIIRRRLRQKYEALMDQIAISVQPSEQELQAFLDENPEPYRSEARYDLRHLFFSSDRREDAQSDAAAALGHIQSAGADAPDVQGDSISLPLEFTNTREAELANRFGPEFVTALADVPVGQWSGPVPSAFGFHLVYVSAYEPGRAATLNEAREAVLRDWRERQVNEAREAMYAALLERYSVTLEPPPPS